MRPADQLSFNSETSTLTVEPFEGIVFLVGGKEVTGEVKITRPTMVRARPRGRLIDKGAQTEWKIHPSITSEEDSLQPEGNGDSENQQDTPDYSGDGENQ